MNVSPEDFPARIKIENSPDDLGPEIPTIERAGYSNRISRVQAFKNTVVSGQKIFNAIQINVYLRQALVQDGFALKGWVHANPAHAGSAGIWLTYNYQNPGDWEAMWTPPHGPSYESTLRPVRKNDASAILFFVPYEQDFSKVAHVDFWIQSWFNGQHEWVDGWYRNDRHISYPQNVNYP